MLTHSGILNFSTVRSCQLQPNRNDVNLFPVQLDEKVEKLQLLALGAQIIVLAQEQAVSTVVKFECPFKGGHCRY